MGGGPPLWVEVCGQKRLLQDSPVSGVSKDLVKVQASFGSH